MYLLGIDIGTGSTKAVAVGVSGKILYTTQESYPTLHPARGFAEQDPELIWAAFVKCVNTAASHVTSPCAGISFSSAMHSLICVDQKGDALTNVILWADNRSAQVAQRLRQSGAGAGIYESTGTPIHPMSPLCKILWLRENDPLIFRSTYKFISIKEYIWNKLFDAYEVDYSVASATGLFNIHELEWNQESLSMCEIDERKLSRVVAPDFVRSDMKPGNGLSLPARTPCVIGSSDGCLANLGTMSVKPGRAALTIGTSGAIRVATLTPICDHKTMPFNYRLDRDLFITGGAINNGGVAIRWYAENFLNTKLNSKEDYDRFLHTATEVTAGSDGLIFLPYIFGERAPIWNSAACGVFFGIHSQHTQKYFTRSVIEGIGMALYQIAQSLLNNHARIDEINASGGFVRSAPWVQVLADIFGRNINVINSEDASAIGAAFLAMRALGHIKNYEQLELKQYTTFYPDETAHETYSKFVYPRFARLYEAIKDEMYAWDEVREPRIQSRQY